MRGERVERQGDSRVMTLEGALTKCTTGTVLGKKDIRVVQGPLPFIFLFVSFFFSSVFQHKSRVGGGVPSASTFILPK